MSECQGTSWLKKAMFNNNFRRLTFWLLLKHVFYRTSPGNCFWRICATNFFSQKVPSCSIVNVWNRPKCVSVYLPLKLDFLFSRNCLLWQEIVKEIIFFKCVYPNGHSFFTEKCKILKLYPNGHFVFLQQNKNFEKCTQTAIRFFTTKYRILKVVPKQTSVFPTRKYEI